MIEVQVEGKRVFLKKSGDSYRVIHPIKVDNKIVWKNLIAGGNWWNLVWIGLFIVVLYGLFNEYASNLELTSACLRALPDSSNLQVYLDNLNLTYETLWG